MTNISLEFNQAIFSKARAMLNAGVGKPVEMMIKRIAGYAETRMGVNASRIVYSYKPKTNTYKRTGRLLGGRGSSLSGGGPSVTKLSNLAVRLEANPQLKGASMNYAGLVNEGTKRMKARPFFTKTVQETQKQGPILAQEEMTKYLSSIRI